MMAFQTFRVSYLISREYHFAMVILLENLVPKICIHSCSTKEGSGEGDLNHLVAVDLRHNETKHTAIMMMFNGRLLRHKLNMLDVF